MGPYIWVDGKQAVRGTNVRPDAVVGGRAGGQPLILCRARHQGGVHPGKLWAGRCNIGWGGKEIAATDFDVLVRTVRAQQESAFPTDVWRDPSTVDTKITFHGGQDRNQSLRVCRAQLQDGAHPGKEVAGKCNLGWGGRELTVDKYEVLVLPNLLAGGQIPNANRQTAASPQAPQTTTQTVTPGVIKEQPTVVKVQPLPTDTTVTIIQNGKPVINTSLDSVRADFVLKEDDIKVKIPSANSAVPFPDKPSQSHALCGAVVNQQVLKPCGFDYARYEGPALDCPQGTFGDLGQCWTCPAGFERALFTSVDSSRACSRPNAAIKGEFTSANIIGPLCKNGAFFDGIREGECWKCDAGYQVAVLPHVDAPNKCFIPAHDEFRYADRVKRTPWPTDCKPGQFHDTWDGGACWTCPAGFVRNGYPIYDEHACSRGVAEQIKKAVVQSRAACPSGYQRFAEDKGGLCWKCPDTYDRSVLPVDGPLACERGAGIEFAKAISKQVQGCASDQMWDPIAVNATLLQNLNARGLTKKGTPGSTGPSCWTCPKFTRRTTTPVYNSDACYSLGIEWETQPYPEPGLFGFAGADAVVVEFLRDHRVSLEDAIVGFAQAQKLPLDATRNEIWTEIRDSPQTSALLKTAILGRLQEVLTDPGKASANEKILVASFAEYLKARRSYIVADALQAYDTWAETDRYRRASRTDLQLLYDYGQVPPDFHEIAHAGAIAGLLGGQSFAFAGMVGAARGIPAVRKAIFPFARKAAETAAKRAIMKGGEEVVKKAATTAATRISGAAARMLISLGPQIILTLAIEAITSSIEQIVAIEDARPKLLAKLAGARQPVDFKFMMASDDGPQTIDAFWGLAMAGERKPSKQAADQIATLAGQLVNVPRDALYLQAESTVAEGVCVGHVEGKIEVRPCADLTTGWSFTVNSGEVRNLSVKACLDIAQNGQSPTLADCDARKQTQRWSLSTEGRIKNTGAGTCLGVTGKPQAGSEIVLQDCARVHLWRQRARG